MTIEEMQQRQAFAEVSIQRILQAFLDETGVSVSAIDYDRIDITPIGGTRRRMLTPQIRLRVEL